MDWQNFWTNYPSQFTKDEFFKQVGKTFKGQTISNTQFNIIISEVINKIGLRSNDFVLDLCCGNGLITSAIAKECQYVVGVDYSEPLIKIA